MNDGTAQHLRGVDTETIQKNGNKQGRRYQLGGIGQRKRQRGVFAVHLFHLTDLPVARQSEQIVTKCQGARGTAGAPQAARQNEKVAGGLQTGGIRGAGTSSAAIHVYTLRLLREMSVLDVYFERAAALMTKSFPRGIADSSTKDEELTMPRAKARSASWNTNMRCKLLQRYQNKSAICRPALGACSRSPPPENMVTRAADSKPTDIKAPWRDLWMRRLWARLLQRKSCSTWRLFPQCVGMW